MAGFKRVFCFNKGGGEKTRAQVEQEGPYKMEETQMTEDFKVKRQKYTEYGVAVPSLTRALAFLIHPAPTELIDEQPDGQPEPEDGRQTPIQILATGIETLIDSDEDEPEERAQMDKVARRMQMAGKTVEQAADITQQHEQIMGVATRPLRHFNQPGGLHEGYTTAIQNFDEARERMDICKCDVKNAPSTLEIEKRAIVLKKAVEDFDTKCTVAVGYLDQLPKITDQHGNSFSTAFELHRAYHQEMAETLKNFRLDG